MQRTIWALAIILGAGCNHTATPTTTKPEVEEIDVAAFHGAEDCADSNDAWFLIARGREALDEAMNQTPFVRSDTGRGFETLTLLMRASTCYLRALEYSPNNYQAALGAGVAHLSLAEFISYLENQSQDIRPHIDRAKKWIGHAYALRYGQQEALFYLAELAFLEATHSKKTDFSRAERYLEPLLETSYKLGAVNLLLARIAEQRKQDERARFHFVEAIRVSASRSAVDYALRKLKNQDVAPWIASPIIRTARILEGDKRFKIKLMPFKLAKPTPSLVKTLTTTGSTKTEAELERTSPSGTEALVSAMLLTEIKRHGRFEALSNTAEDSAADGYLSAVITSDSAASVCLEFTLINSVNHHILYAVGTCIPKSRGLPSREFLRKQLVPELSLSVKELQAAKVTGADGRFVHIDAGKDDELSVGINGYIIGTGFSIANDAARDACGYNPRSVGRHAVAAKREAAPISDSIRAAIDTLSEDVASYTGSQGPQTRRLEQFIIGEVVIISVENKSSIGWLFKRTDLTIEEEDGGVYAIAGDIVCFK